MSWVHIHLLANHVPLTGVLLCLAALLVGQWRQSLEVTRFGLGALAFMGLASFVVYATGDMAAAETASTAAAPASHLVEDHQSSAKVAMIATSALGTGALWALLIPRPSAPRPVIWALIVGSVLCAALMAWTAAVGGEMRHPSSLGPAPKILEPPLDNILEPSQPRAESSRLASAQTTLLLTFASQSTALEVKS